MSELAPGQPQRLLLVEDDAEVRGALEELLKMEGFETLTASNGAEALRLLLQGSRVDLILLDLMMPVMDGWEFRLEQRRTPVLAQIPESPSPQTPAPRRPPSTPTATCASPMRFRC